MPEKIEPVVESFFKIRFRRAGEMVENIFRHPGPLLDATLASRKFCEALGYKFANCTRYEIDFATAIKLRGEKDA